MVPGKNCGLLLIILPLRCIFAYPSNSVRDEASTIIPTLRMMKLRRKEME